ncbi:MAG: hypothetical protein N3A72_05920 [bacterium]|nr:hypothetical protein [bacterium]
MKTKSSNIVSWLTIVIGVMVIMVSATVTVVPVYAAQFAEARIFFEYNSTDNDLGVHVFLDAEDWNTLSIIHPNGQKIFEVATKEGFKKYGLTEMSFEGAEPPLTEVPLQELLAQFPKGKYKFIGTTISGTRLESMVQLSHAVPAGPKVSAVQNGVNSLTISWEPVTAPAKGFPEERIEIVGYQVIVGSFQVTLPASCRSIKVPEEYFRTLKHGKHMFEVLAIDASGNQTITESSFVKK